MKNTVIAMVAYAVIWVALFGLCLVALVRGTVSWVFVGVSGTIAFAFFVALIVSAYGLWNMKTWARKTAIASIYISGFGLISLTVLSPLINRLSAPETKVAFGEKVTLPKCAKCGVWLNPTDDWVPETGELVCPKCGHLQKRTK